MICIILNMLQMAISIETSTAKFDLALSITNYFFTAVFTIEMVLKLIAFRFTYFWANWNKFDFVVVISSWVDIIFSQTSSA